MQHTLVPKAVVLLLLVGALILPVAISVLFGLAKLLVAMDDPSGGEALSWIALAAGVFWVLDLVSLVIVLAIHSLASDDPKDDS